MPFTYMIKYNKIRFWGSEMIVKTEQELNSLKEIGEICALALQEMAAALRPGITTAELDEIGHQALKRRQARSAPVAVYKFPGYTCISVNDEVAHGKPGARVLREGDMVNIDVSACKNGFFADTGASFIIPPESKLKQKILQCSHRALQKALEQAKAGNPLNFLGRAVEEEAKRSGLTVIKNLCGHGVGRTLHEEPETIYNYYEKKDKRVILPGMVLAIETFISQGDQYVLEEPDGWTLKTPNRSLTAQFEHTVVVTEGEPIILTVC